MPTFYLKDLDTSETLTVSATMSGTSETISSNATIEKSISLVKAKAIFKCIFTSGSLTTGNPTGNFTTDTDFLTPFQTVLDADMLKFVDGLVTEMTGASGATDVLDNEDTIKTEITTRFGTGITNIEAGAGAGDTACVSLFDQIKYAAPERFKLSSSVPATTGEINGLTYTNCLVTSQSSLETAGSGAKVTGFDYDTKALSIAGRDGSGSAYENGDVLLFIHPVTGTGFSVTINADQAGNLNGNSASTDTLTMTEIAEANITATTFSLFKKLGSGDTEDVTPSGGLVLTTEVGGDPSKITDTTITTANAAGSSNFADGDVIVAYTTGASPQAIVMTLNTITAAYLNNDLANAGGVSMPLLSTDELDFKLTLAAKAGQTDASGDAITYSFSYGLRGTLDLA